MGCSKIDSNGWAFAEFLAVWFEAEFVKRGCVVCVSVPISCAACFWRAVQVGTIFGDSSFALRGASRNNLACIASRNILACDASRNNFW